MHIYLYFTIYWTLPPSSPAFNTKWRHHLLCKNVLSYFTAPGQARIQIQNGGLTGKEAVFIQNIRRYILKNMTFENEYNFNQHRPKKMNKLSYYIAN